jgi:hypothetical protein
MAAILTQSLDLIRGDMNRFTDVFAKSSQPSASFPSSPQRLITATRLVQERERGLLPMQHTALLDLFAANQRAADVYLGMDDAVSRRDWVGSQLAKVADATGAPWLAHLPQPGLGDAAWPGPE